jgi:hypothetical protein
VSAVVAGALALVLVPGGPGEIWRRWGVLAASPIATRPAGAGAVDSPADAVDLGAIRITIAPPAYTGLPAREIDGSEPLSVPVGSMVRLSVPMPPTGVRLEARVLNGPPLEPAGASLPSGEAGARPREAATARWTASWRASSEHRGISLQARSDDRIHAQRVLPIDVVPDREPAVLLELPGEDVVLAAARGTLPVRGSAEDDYGIADFRLHWILSRGGGESFSFIEGEWSWDRTAVDGARRTGEMVLDLSRAQLQPGDVLHVRAVAHDANDITGPGTGVSPTRLIRIARDDEAAEVTTLIGFPIEAERDPILSQRMIVLLTERLIERSPALSAADIGAESARIANEQARLRGRLTDVVYSRAFGMEDEHADEETHIDPAAAAGAPSRADADTMDVGEWTRRMEAVLAAASEATGLGTLEEQSHDHDADPSLAVNRELLGAFNAMYAAERELRQASPSAALPHEYRALEILQRAREAERVFLRGRQTVAPVDVAAARGEGELDDVVPAARSAAPAVADPGSAAARVTALVERVRGMDGRDAANAFAALAAAVLEDPAHDARAGALLGRAAEAAGEGRRENAVSLALQARALLLPPSAAAAPVALYPPGSPDAADYFRRLLGGGL